MSAASLIRRLHDRLDRVADVAASDTVKIILALMASAAVLFAILIPVVVFAADVSVSWTNPTQNTDGSTIPASGAGSLTQTRVEYGSCSGTAFGVKAGVQWWGSTSLRVAAPCSGG